MHRLLPSLGLAVVLSSLVFDVGVADAQPERADVRDHRAPRVERRYRRRPGPRVMMPLKIDIGMTGANTTQGFMPGIELRGGIHWASLSPQPTNTDVGLGLFIAALPGAQNDAMPDADNDVVYGGAYLEVGQTLSHGDWWRTWATGRAEYLGASAFGKDETGFGVAGRVSAELYASGVGIEPRGLFLGTYAFGVYAEVAGRQLGDDVSPVQASAGLTFRTPLVFAP
jgi:hypothetical protein